MTIRELYEWALREGVVDCDIIVRDIDGDRTCYVEPTIERHSVPNGVEYIEVEL